MLKAPILTSRLEQVGCVYVCKYKHTHLSRGRGPFKKGSLDNTQQYFRNLISRQSVFSNIIKRKWEFFSLKIGDSVQEIIRVMRNTIVPSFVKKKTWERYPMPFISNYHTELGKATVGTSNPTWCIRPPAFQAPLRTRDQMII